MRLRLMPRLAGTNSKLRLREMIAPPALPDFLVGDLFQVTGLGLQIVAIISLNRSFGLVPANRGIKRSGMYRLVRHPLYLTYTIALVGFLINNLSLRNTAVLVLATAFQVLRIFREEEFLIQDPEYRDYASRTRWRMIPFVF